MIVIKKEFYVGIIEIILFTQLPWSPQSSYLKSIMKKHRLLTIKKIITHLIGRISFETKKK